MAELIDKFKLPIGLSLVGAVLIIGGLVTSNFNNQKVKQFSKESVVQSSKVKVDVSGAVKSPGVYELSADSRVEQAIAAAGGVSDQVNREYISKSLNLAQKISDGLKVYIPFQGEQFSGSVAGVNAQLNKQVNINTASNSELDSLSGIGPVTSSKIISNRPYQSIDELLSKKIVSKSVFDKIKDLIVAY